MNIRSRLEKLEDASGITKINIGNELERLKELALSGKAPKQQSEKELQQLIAECDGKELPPLYEASISLAI